MATYNRKLAFEHEAPEFLVYYIPLTFFVMILTGGVLKLFRIPKMVVYFCLWWNKTLTHQLRVYRGMANAFPDISDMTLEEKAQRLRLQRKITETQNAIVQRHERLKILGIKTQIVVIIVTKLIIFGALIFFVFKHLYGTLQLFDYIGNDLITDNVRISLVLRFPIKRHLELSGVSVLVYSLCWCVLYTIIAFAGNYFC